eukprot:11903072-Ditylum_brightwellii.AAC.1
MSIFSGKSLAVILDAILHHLIAWLLHTSKQTVDWILSLMSLLKLHFFSYPSEVELPAIDSKQSPWPSLPLIKLIHSVMTAAMCSNKLLDALN